MRNPEIRLSFLICLLGITSASNAQNLGKRTHNLALRLSYRMPKKLTRIPLNRAGVLPVLKDRWEFLIEGPKLRLKKKNSRKSKKSKPKRKKSSELRKAIPLVEWGIHVFSFVPKTAITSTKRRSVAKEGSKKPKARWPTINSFKGLLERVAKKAKFMEEGEDRKQKAGSRLAYKYYHWTDGRKEHFAAVYRKQSKEVALWGYHAQSKARNFAKVEKDLKHQIRLGIESLQWESDRVVRTAVVRGEREFANTKLRKRLLATEKKVLAGYDNWALFCTQQFIVIYSFARRKGRKDSQYRFAARISKQMGEMIANYKKYFPPHPKVVKWWSVLRICHSRKEFQKYGNTRPGVIGWFNPRSKELVLFRNKDLSEAVAYHEGWHQYANFWFGGAQLQRWYDEGFGDFFGAMNRRSMDRWKLMASRMRLATIKKLVADNKHVPLESIVRWHKKQYYGPRASHYYSQGWAMIDFFMRGQDSKFWNPAYAKIIPTYTKIALASKDTNKAVTEAFRGIDWAELEDNWKKYVLSLK